MTERHRIEVRVTLPDGTQRPLTGADERERGGSIKGASDDLADQLETIVKESYWDFVESP